MYRFRSQLGLAALAALAILPTLATSNRALARAQGPEAGARQGHVLTGVDVYETYPAEPFAGNRVGLITNQTGVDSAGRRTIDVLAARKGVKLVAIFSPEHGIDGLANAHVADSIDQKTGVRIRSLYTDTRRPTDDMLSGIDVLVFDIQDAGVRFYTYVTTMAYCMEAAAKHHLRFFVFDRPDPLDGETIEAPMLDPDRTSFTGYFPMPVRYGMTMGELAQMFNVENKIGADLHVEAMLGWRRSETYDQTGLAWIPPSPNLRTLNEAFLYPGIEVLQAGNVSVGRGTDTPFEILGAPWIHGDEFSAALGSRHIPGIRFAPARFTPKSDVYQGEACQGVTISITNRDRLDSMQMGLEIAEVLDRLYPDQFQIENTIELLGSQSTVDGLKRGDAPADIVSGWAADLDKFRTMREKYLLYH
jgi:uncharacterized protein YbbC (DUF1343 family)